MQRRNGLRAVRSSATAKPAMPPVMKTISDRPMVQRVASSKNCRLSQEKSLIMSCSHAHRAQTAAAFEDDLAQYPEAEAEQQGQQDVQHHHDDVDLEAAEGFRVE